MTPQQHIDKLQMLIEARRAGSLTINALESMKKRVRLDQLASKSGAPKPRYKVPARKRVN
jgi:hypothetical protein